MKEAFQKEIKSPFSYPFEVEREGLYAIFLKASCKPGWKNNENYYSWYTFTLVNLPLKSLSITAQAGMREGEKDDDDLKVLINGKTQKNPQNRHPSSYFCGFTLKGKEDTLSKIINLPQSIHYIELFADKTPLLKTIKLIFQKEEKFEAYDPPKKEEGFNPQYVIKDSAFINSDSMSEEEIEGFLRQYGKPLTVLNRATYALYRYTPHIEGANLFYKVYFQFFDKNDLGGKI